MYYGDLYDLWFTQVPANNAEGISDSFMSGGYYQYRLTPTLSVMVLNSIYFNVRNSQDLDTAST